MAKLSAARLAAQAYAKTGAGGGGYSSGGGGSNAYGGYTYNLKDYSYDDLYNNAYGGGIGAYRPDVSGMINAYTQQANADKKNLESGYNTTRNDLLSSLKRYQETNAKQQTTQRQSYLTDQAALDTQKQIANRNARIGNAARGLGGSGLAKLAEIQNDLGMQGDESQLMNENQSILDALRTALAQETEDTNTKLNYAKTDYDNRIRSIDANLAAQIAAANLQADQQYAQSLANARAYAGNSRALANNAYNVLTGNTKALSDALSKQSINQLINTYGATGKNDLGSTIANYYSSLFNNTNGMSANQYNTAMDNVYGLLRAKGLMSTNSYR